MQCTVRSVACSGFSLFDQLQSVQSVLQSMYININCENGFSCELGKKRIGVVGTLHWVGSWYMLYSGTREQSIL